MENTDVKFRDNPRTIEEFADNARFQLNNVAGYMSIKDYESALIKARYLVDALENAVVLKIGLP
jgi:hypothetical protein